MSEPVVAPAPVKPVAPPPVKPAEPVKPTPVPAAATAPEPEPSDEYDIDGRKVTLTRTQARTAIQKAAAADKRMQEATEAKRKLDELLKLADEDFEAFLAKTGKDPAKHLEALLAKKAKLELMSPEQRERAALEAERDALKARAEKSDKEKREAAQAELDSRNEAALAEQLVSAAEKYHLDSTPEVLEGMASVAMDLLDYGVTPSVDEVAQEYLRRESEHLEKRDKKIFSRLKGKKLLEYLGESALKEIDAAREAMRAASLASAPAPKLKPRDKDKPLPARDNAGKYTSESDFDRKVGLRR